MEDNVKIKKIISKAGILFQSNQHAELVKLLLKSIKKYPKSAVLFLNLHMAYFDLGMEAMDRAITLDPNVKDTPLVYKKYRLSPEEDKDLSQILKGMVKVGQL